MKKIREYYRGKPCKADIGADGQIKYAVGRITGEVEGALPTGVLNTPSAVHFTTPHGSTFELAFNQLYELDQEDKDLMKFYEKDAKLKEGFLWYGKRLDDVSHDIINLE